MIGYCFSCFSTNLFCGVAPKAFNDITSSSSIVNTTHQAMNTNENELCKIEVFGNIKEKI